MQIKKNPPQISSRNNADCDPYNLDFLVRVVRVSMTGYQKLYFTSSGKFSEKTQISEFNP